MENKGDTSKKVNIEQQTWFTNKQVLALLAAAIIVTFSATEIWNRFEFVELNQQLNEQSQANKDAEQDKEMKYLNGRIDRKFEQLKDHVNQFMKKPEKPEEE